MLTVGALVTIEMHVNALHVRSGAVLYGHMRGLLALNRPEHVQRLSMCVAAVYAASMCEVVVCLHCPAVWSAALCE